MDSMDESLARLPSEPLPHDLTERVRARFRRRLHRRQVGQAATSTVLLLAGAWLFTPWLLSWLAQVNLPSSGLQLLGSFSGQAQMNQLALQAVGRLAWLTDSLSQTASFYHGLGLVSMSAGTLLGIRLLLPGRIA